MTIRIVLAEDQQIVRQGLRRLLDAEPDLSVVGETGDGLEVLPLLGETNPDVLLLDVLLPGLNGMEVAGGTKAQGLSARVVVLTALCDAQCALRAMRNGADAYVVKDSDASDLVDAIHAVMRGHRYVTPGLCAQGMHASLDRLGQRAPEDAYSSLTGRERETVQLAAEGRTNAQVAARLGISTRTAEVHRSKAMAKLGLHSQTELVYYAIRHGIVSVEAGSLNL